MHGWTRDDRVMIACCNDGTRPVVFKLERIDIPEPLKKRLGWLLKIFRFHLIMLLLVKIRFENLSY